MNDTYVELTSNELAEDIREMPETIPVILLRDQVALPKITLPLFVSLNTKQLIDDVINGDRLIGLVTSIKPGEKDPNPEHLY